MSLDELYQMIYDSLASRLNEDGQQEAIIYSKFFRNGIIVININIHLTYCTNAH